MGLLSNHESSVWKEFQKGKTTSQIANKHKNQQWSPAYVSRVLNRARKKIAKKLKEHANSHRLDIESLLDYKGLLIGYDYQTSTPVYIIFTQEHGIIVWYQHESYAGKLCPECPKETECKQALNSISKEYDISLRPQETALYMTKKSTSIFNKLAAKTIPRYKREGGDKK
jgi:hypothetical protein